MYNYTDNNHVQFGYIEKDGTCNMDTAGVLRRSSKDQIFTVDYLGCSHEPGSWKDECLIAAEKIYESTDLPINILFSGGIDGEAGVRIFSELGVPFKVSIMKFKDNLNLHDISYAIIYCEQHNIKYDIIELDLIKFLEQDMFDYAISAEVCHPTVLPILWLVDQIDGLPIITAGEHTMEKEVPDGYVPGESPYEPGVWTLNTKEVYSSWYKHFINQDRPGIPRFYEYSPEMMYSFLLDPIVIDLVNNRLHGKLGLVTSKYNVYSRYFDNLIERPKNTGFEKIKDIEAKYIDKLLLLNNNTDVFKIEYTALLEKLKYHDI